MKVTVNYLPLIRYRPIVHMRCVSRQLLFVACSAIYLVYIIQWTDIFYQQTNTLTAAKVDRRTCCLSSDRLTDICGRPNCTLLCPQPEVSTIEPDCYRKRCHDNAFFFETSGKGSLNIRQACAVESLALHNPNLTVNIIFVDVAINTSVVLQKLIGKYSNIRLVSIDLEEYLAGSVLEQWYHCTDWRNGSFYVNNLSNALRLITLMKYGGYYFDLDIIFLHPITYYRNFVAAEDDIHLNNGAIHADLNNPVIQLAMEDFVKNFNPRIWGRNGPALILRVLKNWCNVTDVQAMDYITCRGFNVLPKAAFHPIPFRKVNSFFIHPKPNETKAIWLTDKVVAVHTWNKLSKDKPVYKNSMQTYAQLVRHNCPVVFSIAPPVF